MNADAARLLASLSLQLEAAYRLAAARPRPPGRAPAADPSTLLEAIDDARACTVRLNAALARPCRGPLVQPWPFPQIQEIDMSADRDRGVRRVKQKRAKDQKRAARQQHSEAVAQRAAGNAPAKKAG